MTICVGVRGGPRLNPVTALAAVLVVAGLFGAFRRAGPRGGSPETCDAAEGVRCDDGAGAPEAQVSANGPAGTLVLDAGRACRDVGYLCAELAHIDRVRVRRWKDFSGTIVVHIPRPDIEEAGDAVRLQQAAAAGVRLWNGQPFEILTDLRGDRGPHFAVHWTRGLGGNQIGVARTEWTSAAGLSVVSIELTTRNPFNPAEVIDPRQVRLTAAHEMGHALGLPHSDARRDVMYPTNTATSLSAQDYRTMEALYELEDGTEIVR